MTAIEHSSPRSEGALAPLVRLVGGVNGLLSRIPHWLIASLARFSIAAVFWKSGQTKVEGLAIDLVQGQFQIGMPHFSSSAIDLFRDEYRVPLLPPEIAAFMAASAEHVFSALILVGLATRLSATALLLMTLVIEIFVYPDAWPTHLSWAGLLLFLIARGGGAFSLDRIARLP